MVQKYLVYLQKDKIDILNDRIDEKKERFYTIDTRKIEKQYDFIIASAHDPNAFSYKKTGKLVIVVSHIPDMQDESWASFYVNLCMSDAIACDSFIKTELSKVTYPDKRIILLDGCVPETLKAPIINLNEKIGIVSLDANQDFWRKFSRFVAESDRFHIATSIGRNCVGIAFRPMSSVLAINMTHKLYHIQSAYDTLSSIYLDSRCNHHLFKRLGHLVNMGGEAPNKPFREAFELLLEDLDAILGHTARSPIFKFTSNVTIYDRIFHEINRTNAE